MNTGQHTQAHDTDKDYNAALSLDRIQQTLRQAFAHHGEGRLEEAERLYTEVLSLAPDNPYVCFNLGIIRHSRGELPQAISCYREVLAREPDHFQVLYHLGNAYRDNQCLEEAVITYKRAITVKPEHADTHYNLGITYYQQGNLELSAASYEQTVALDPGHSHALYNLGIIHFEQGRYEAAADCYQRALAIRPGDVDCCYNLGLTLSRLGRHEEAAARYEQALDIAPDDPELYNTLGTAHKQLHELEKAAECYRKAIALRPDYGKAYTNLAIVLHILDQLDEAVSCYRKAIELGHDPLAAEYMIAALTGRTLETTPRSYVENLFDNYADSFDKSLTIDLEYNVPALLRSLFDSFRPAEAGFGKLLDLGCGTGLAGQRFRDVAASLTGVDLSGKMLARAKEKDLYDQLHRADIVEFLEREPVEYDLFLAADVLIYHGNLEPFFKAVAARAPKDALFLFSVEQGDESKEYVLRRSGRYAHSRTYIERLAAESGFVAEIVRQAGLRKEKEAWITGLLFLLRKG